MHTVPISHASSQPSALQGNTILSKCLCIPQEVTVSYCRHFPSALHICSPLEPTECNRRKTDSMGWKGTTWGLFKYSILIAWRVSKSTSTSKHTLHAPLELARMLTSNFAAFISLFQLGCVKLFPFHIAVTSFCPTDNFKSLSFTKHHEKEANQVSLTLKRCPNLKTKVRKNSFFLIKKACVSFKATYYSFYSPIPLPAGEHS